MTKNFSEVPKNLGKQEIKKPEEMGEDLNQMNSQQLAEFYRRQQFEKSMEAGKEELRDRIKTETVVGPGGSLGIRRIGERKKQTLTQKRLEIDNIFDAEGKGIDEEIKDVIIALNIADFPTTASCQGHYGEEPGGIGAPWVEIGASDEPEERFNNQNAIFQRIAEKYKMPLEELRRSFNPDAYWEAMKEASEQGETVEYQEWDKKNQELFKKAQNLLDEFYKDRQVDDSLKLQLEEWVGGFRIHNGGEDYKDLEENISEEEKEAHRKRLIEYQKEMNRFAKFLLDKFRVNLK
jgi:hypothetical protein